MRKGRTRARPSNLTASAEPGSATTVVQSANLAHFEVPTKAFHRFAIALKFVAGAASVGFMKVPSATVSARFRRTALTSAICLLCSGCGEVALHSVAEGMGRTPVLPQPVKTLIPTVEVAKATGWPAQGKPMAASGTTVARFADGLDHPRWLYVLPNGDVLVAETNGPPTAGRWQGIKGVDHEAHDEEAGAGSPARTASRCCAMPTATASRKRGRPSSKGSTRPSAWRSSATSSTWPTRCGDALSLYRRRARPGSSRPASRWLICRPVHQSPLDQEPHCQPRTARSST